MNCTPKGTEPVVGVAENLASGAGVLGVLLQPVKAANASVTKARTATSFAIDFPNYLRLSRFSAPDRRYSTRLRCDTQRG